MIKFDKAIVYVITGAYDIHLNTGCPAVLEICRLCHMMSLF